MICWTASDTMSTASSRSCRLASRPLRYHQRTLRAGQHSALSSNRALAEFRARISDITLQIMPLAIAEIQQSLRIMLHRATEWDYAPERIGAIGFSAGDRIAIELTIPSDPEIRLAFVASIYGVLFSDMIGDGSVHQLASVFLPVFPHCSWLSLQMIHSA